MFNNLLLQNKLVENVVVYNDRAASTIDGDFFSTLKSNNGVGGLINKLRDLNKKRSAQGLSLLILAIPLSACGGGDDAAPLTEVTGRAIDGYLANSKVFLSSNPDVFVRTSDAVGSQGSFEGLFGTGSIVVREGVDISTGKTFTGELKAPEGSKVVTPITTIVEAVVSQAAASGNTTVTPAVAAQQVAKGLGLQSTSDILNTDFVESGSAGMAKAAAKVASVISVVTASTGDGVSAAVLGNIAAKVAKAGEVGGKANVLNDAAELKTVFAEVRETQAELFADQPETLDLDVLIENVSNVVAKVSAQVDAAASLKDIAATQQAVQDDIVVAFTVDAENPEAFDPTVFEAALAEIDEGFEALIAESVLELDAYIETADVGLDFDVVLDFADIDDSVVVIDLGIIDGAIDGTIPDELVTGFVFGEVELETLDGVLDGTIDAAAVEELIAALPEFEIFPDLPPITDVPGEIPVDEIPVDIPTEVSGVVLGGGGGGGGGGSTAVVGDVITVGVSAGGSITSALAQAKLSVDEATDNIVINLASGRYSENVTIDADALGVASVTINGANAGTSLKPNVSKSADITTSGTSVARGLAFDTADGSRASNESWIDGAITVASDKVTLDGLRLHSYNGPLKFDGNDIDSFTVKNSYITGFNGADSFRYTGNGVNEGWNISGNMIGGVSGGVGGSLYLENINAATVTENVFFRPAAAHMYLTDTNNVTVASNLFYHGVHADGANFDGQLAAFQAADANGYGYVGFSGGTGYGYGFGYGYGSSSGASITEMGAYGGYGGKGPTGYAPEGYGNLVGGGSNQADYLYYGRNYIAEVKGDSDAIAFDGNWGLYNSGGIQFWDGGISGHHFNSVTITDNQMAGFINADQDGLLASLTSRHKSGLIGGVVFQVNDDNGSEDLYIYNNKIYGSIDQIKNVNDLDALIEVGGGVKDVDIVSNTLSWNLSDSFSGTIEALNDNSSDKKQGDQTNGSTTYQIHTQGVLLYGDIEDTVVASGTFATDKIADNSALTNEYISHAILLVDDTASVPSAFGNLTANINHGITTADYGSALPLVTINNSDTDAYAGTLTNLL